MNRFMQIILLAMPLGMAVADQSDIGLLPQDKAPVTVADDERNPFGRRTPKGPVVVEETENEEAKIRGLIAKLPLGGMTRGYGVTKVLVGSFTVEEGQVLPDLIPNQTEKVRVLSVTGGQVELGFVDKDGTADIRKIVLIYDLKPEVRFKLGGSAPGAASKDGKAAASFGGVMKKDGPEISQ